MKIYLVIKEYWYEGDEIVSDHRTKAGSKKCLQYLFKKKEAFKKASPTGEIKNLIWRSDHG